jgi:fumarate reductase subunit C
LKAISYPAIRCMEKSWNDNKARYNTTFSKRIKVFFVVILVFNIGIGCREMKAYKQGVNSFLDFAFRNSVIGNKILCPCRKCVNTFWREASEVGEHLICDGFLKGYRRLGITWIS